MYRSSYDKNNENIPEEFIVNLIDERINIYNNYNDDLYEDFIIEAKKIFKKYEKECNPDNKYLNYLKEDCKFNDKNLHGGYKCGDDGKWNKKCVPFYCDENYYFEPNRKKCILLKEKNKENKDKNNISKYIIIFRFFKNGNICFNHYKINYIIIFMKIYNYFFNKINLYIQLLFIRFEFEYFYKI